MLNFAVFLTGGLIFARVAAFPKFALWSVVVCVIFGIFEAVWSRHVVGALGEVLLDFFALQVGYVAGTALATFIDSWRHGEAPVSQNTTGMKPARQVQDDSLRNP